MAKSIVSRSPSPRCVTPPPRIRREETLHRRFPTEDRRLRFPSEDRLRRFPKEDRRRRFPSEDRRRRFPSEDRHQRSADENRCLQSNPSKFRRHPRVHLDCRSRRFPSEDLCQQSSDTNRSNPKMQTRYFRPSKHQRSRTYRRGHRYSSQKEEEDKCRSSHFEADMDQMCLDFRRLSINENPRIRRVSDLSHLSPRKRNTTNLPGTLKPSDTSDQSDTTKDTEMP
uniref:Transformer n=1 Tax=Steinernema glaseri TaxID=37863 RepID=A0A1I7ZNY4_9BILA